MTPPDNTRRAYIAWVLVCVVWGTTYLAIRIAIDTIPPFLMTAFRWLAAGTLLIGIFRIRGERMPGVRDWPGLLLLGVLMIGLGNGAVVWAEQTVPSGLASVLVAVTPFWMLGVERIVRHRAADSSAADALTPRRFLGLVVGFSGIVLLLWPELRLGESGGFLAGAIATQVATLGWAVGSTYSKRRARSENVLVAAAFQMLFAGVVMLVAGTVLGEWQGLSFSTRSTAALAYLVCVGSLVGYTAYAYALKHLPVSTVSLYAYVNPIIAVALGTIILDEPLSPRIVVASAVVLVGIGVVRE